MRKNSYCNRNKAGTETQAILMSVFQTFKQRKNSRHQHYRQSLATIPRNKKFANLKLHSRKSH